MLTAHRPSAVLVALALALVVPLTSGPAGASPPPDGGMPPAGVAAAGGGSDIVADLRDEAEAEGSVALLVALSDDGGAGEALRAELAGTSFEVRPVTASLLAVEADAEALDRLADTDLVAELGADPILRVAQTPPSPASPTLGAAATTRPAVAHDLGITGAGRAVAIIDTGVDRAHPALAGAVVAEACFVAQVGGRCPNGQPTQIGPGAGVPCTSTGAACGHGTHVAGIAAARPVGSFAPGVAPGAQLVAIRIFDAGPGGSGEIAARTSDLIAALHHVKRLRQRLPIDAVNLSMSGDALYDGSCDHSSGTEVGAEQLARAVDELRAVGVATVVATGNGGNPQRVSFPSCLSNVLRVAATTGADIVAPFSNRNAQVTLAAPGTDIVAAAPGSRAEPRSGTSMATPQISGAIALLRQRYDPPGVSWLVTRLESTAKVVDDTATGRSLRRLDVAAALGLAPTDAGDPVPAAGAWVVTDAGRAVGVGAAASIGARPALGRGERVVAASPTRSALGFWMTSDRGRVIGTGDARLFGDARNLALNQPITAMAPTSTGGGYWLLGADGGIFTFGDARFHGSTGAFGLNAPVTDLAPTGSDGGYWLTARDGGVFSFGDARFHGSTGGMVLNRPVVSIAAGPSSGYWLVALDGGVFAFDAPFLGSLPSSGVVSSAGYRIRSSASGTGYHILTTDGAVRAFGRATGFGPAGLNRGERAVDLVIVP